MFEMTDAYAKQMESATSSTEGKKRSWLEGGKFSHLHTSHDAAIIPHPEDNGSTKSRIIPVSGMIVSPMMIAHRRFGHR